MYCVFSFFRLSFQVLLLLVITFTFFCSLLYGWGWGIFFYLIHCCVPNRGIADTYYILFNRYTLSSESKWAFPSYYIFPYCLICDDLPRYLLLPWSKLFNFSICAPALCSFPNVLQLSGSFFFFFLSSLYPQTMEVSRLGVKLNLLSEARDQTCILMDTSQICYLWVITGTLWAFFFLNQ